MNIFTRFGRWLERPSVRQELETLRIHDAALFVQILKTIEQLQADKQVPSSTAKELKIMSVRLDRIELLVGLKRDPVLHVLPDAPRIS